MLIGALFCCGQYCLGIVAFLIVVGGVTVAIAIVVGGITGGVVTVLAVTVSRSVHIHAVEDDVRVAEAVVANSLMEHLEAVLGRVRSAGDIELDVGVRSDEESIGDHADRSGIDDDIVEVLAELKHQALHIVAKEELVGVRRHGTGGKDVEVVAQITAVHERSNVRSLPGEESGDALLVAEPELVSKYGTADIHTDDDNLLACESVCEREVGGYESLAFAGD